MCRVILIVLLIIGIRIYATLGRPHQIDVKKIQTVKRKKQKVV